MSAEYYSPGQHSEGNVARLNNRRYYARLNRDRYRVDKDYAVHVRDVQTDVGRIPCKRESIYSLIDVIRSNWQSISRVSPALARDDRPFLFFFFFFAAR